MTGLVQLNQGFEPRASRWQVIRVVCDNLIQVLERHAQFPIAAVGRQETDRFGVHLLHLRGPGRGVGAQGQITPDRRKHE